MEIEFHPDMWLQTLAQFPAVLAILGGLLGGTGFTQAIKKTYLVFANGSKVNDKRYRISVQWLAVLSTFFCINTLWHAMARAGIMHETTHELRHVVSIMIGLPSPFFYTGCKSLVSYKWPEFAKKWGDSDGGHK